MKLKRYRNLSLKGITKPKQFPPLNLSPPKSNTLKLFPSSAKLTSLMRKRYSLKKEKFRKKYAIFATSLNLNNQRKRISSSNVGSVNTEDISPTSNSGLKSPIFAPKMIVHALVTE